MNLFQSLYLNMYMYSIPNTNNIYRFIKAHIIQTRTTEIIMQKKKKSCYRFE